MTPPEDGKTSSLRGAKTLGGIGAVRLRVVNGPDQGREVVLQEGTAVVGTRADCTLILTDETVSRRHASVELLRGRLRVRDLGSKNGTVYRGARVDTVVVPLGAIVEVGQTQLALLPPALPAGTVSQGAALQGLVGRSPKMRALFAQIEQAGPTEAPVLVSGETGSGKELVARALHALSTKSRGPVRFFHCAAIQSGLLPSALFGHARGAFTGAVKEARGELEEADGGTLVLDGVGELPLEFQPILLRAVETRSFQRVGETRTRKVDFRLIATTHRDLESEVAGGKFRRDLYYRLAAIVLSVPPLRERLEDVPLLAEHFAQQEGSTLELSPAMLAPLSAYQWPGNVRELRNVVQRAVALGPRAGLLSSQAEEAEAPADFHQAREQAVKAFERSYLEAVLKRHGGSVAAAAREAGLARSYFYRLIEDHGLARDKGKKSE